MKNRQIAVMLSLVMIFSLSMTGCKDENADPLMSNSKEQLIEMIHDLEYQKSVIEGENIELAEKMKGIQTEEVKQAGITEFSDGTGRLTLNSIDTIVKLPLTFGYPMSTQYPNNSTVNLTEGISIKPSSNWIVNISGTQVNLQHSSSNISGNITIGGFESKNNRPRVEDLNAHINEYFSNMPPDNLNTSRIYVDKTWSGINVKTHTFIDEKDAQLRCGLIGYGDINITYLFAYTGEENPSNDELISNLLQTMQIYKNDVKIE